MPIIVEFWAMGSPSEPNEKKEPLDKHSTRYLRAYDEASKYVIRELNLINNRLTWILSIHGFLYATYGFALDNLLGYLKGYGKACEDISYLEAIRLDLFMATITFVGMVISIAGFVSINAACLAMQAVEEGFFDSNIRHHRRSIVTNTPSRRRRLRKVKVDVSWYVSDFGYILPHLLGGGAPSADSHGNRASRAIPVVLLISWVAALGGFIYTFSSIVSDPCEPKSIYEHQKIVPILR